MALDMCLDVSPDQLMPHFKELLRSDFGDDAAVMQEVSWSMHVM